VRYVGLYREYPTHTTAYFHATSRVNRLLSGSPVPQSIGVWLDNGPRFATDRCGRASQHSH